MNKKLRKAIEECGWNINSDTSITIFTDTTGREVTIECNEPKELIQTIKNYYEGYDVDEEVELYLQAKQNGLSGVPNARTLVKDCEEVETLLEKLYEAIMRIS